MDFSPPKWKDEDERKAYESPPRVKHEFKPNKNAFDDFFRTYTTPSVGSDIFGLRRTKSHEELRSVYRKLCLKHHPDKGGTSEMFVKLQKEYKACQENPLFG